MTKSILFLILGLGSIALAFGNGEFYWLKGWFAGEKPAPRWAGRLLFGVIGVVFLLFGLARLVAN